jgi:hypothetical protein
MPSFNEVEVRTDGFIWWLFTFINMEKEAFYFPHFCNARHDRKIRRLRKELGTEGYGIYFMLLETLREQQDLMYPLEDLDLLAEEFNVSEAKVRVAICNYGLFEIDEEQKFFSPKMLVYLEPYFKMKEQRKVAGQRSADKRKSIDISTTVQRPFNDRSTKERKENESKENESKVNESKVGFSEMLSPHIDLLNSEYDNFFSYWTEKDNKGKERWEAEKYFDILRRINTWMKNNNKFSSPIIYNSQNQVKGKHQTNLDNIELARQQIQKLHENGTYKNPFAIGD